MKAIRLFFCVCCLFCVNSLFAQEEEVGNGLLFPQFEKGVVVFKNTTRAAASLNYNMVREEMLFLDSNGQVLAIAKPSDIVIMLIGDRRFVPASSKGIFYEEVETGSGSFFIQRKSNFLSEGKAAGYGGYSQTASVQSWGTFYDGSSGQTVKLNPDEKFKIKNDYFFYLKSGNSFKKFSSAKTLGKLFKGQESKIEAFAKEHSINFSNTDDVAKIVEYGYSLVNK